MGADSRIEWCDDTVNPWWGCQKVSPACTSCYAETMAARFGRGSWGPQGERALRVDACLADLARFARRGIREGRARRVFLGSMCDVFEQRRDLIIPRIHLWDGLAELSRGRLAKWIRVMVLTKRAKAMADYARHHGWPRICWAGVTAEDQERADERIPHLLRVPAAMRFVSCEPLLSRVNLDPWLGDQCDECDGDGHLHEYGDGGICCDDCDTARCCPRCGGSGWFERPILDWVIAGGESGPHARPPNPDWFRSLRDQCQEAGVPFHFKGWGQWMPRSHTTQRHSWHAERTPDADSWRVDVQAGARWGTITAGGEFFESTTPWAGHDDDGEGEAVVYRLGRARTGRVLDGAVHDTFPGGAP